MAGQDLNPVPIIGVKPIFCVIGVAGRVEMRIADRPTERAVLILVDVTRSAAPAVFGKILVASAALVQLTAYVECDSTLAIFERPNGSKINGASKAHARNTCVGSLVDDNRAQQLGWILVELDRSVEAGTCLLAPVQQNRRKVRRKATNRHD